MMAQYKKIIFGAGIAGAFLFFPLASLAQSSVTITSNPGLPPPYGTVELTLNSFSVDLDRSEISWLVNDKLQTKSIGGKKFSYKMGALGSSVKIGVSINTTDGKRVVSSITLRPGEITLLWEGHSYVPSFYKGRALLPSSGAVIVTAFPELAGTNGRKLDPGKLMYTWEQDGVVLSSGSGYGKQSIVLKGSDIARLKTNISVTVSSPDGSVQASADTGIPAVAPYILLYEKRQLEGIRYEEAMVGKYEVRTPDVAVRAEPYYYSIDNYRDGKLEYNWTLSGQSLPAAQRARQELSFQGGSGSQTVQVGLRIRNPVRTLQSASAGVSILFGGQNKF